MLETVDSVIKAVGGPSKAAALAGVSLPAVSNWKSRGKISAGKFVIFRDELASLGQQVSPTVFGFKAEVRA